VTLDLTYAEPLATARLPVGSVPPDRYYCEWGALVGGRIRRTRRQRRMTLQALGVAMARVRPDGRGPYTAGFVSRLERGLTNASLFIYLAIADALEVDPGVLLGPDAAALQVSEAEAVLLRCVRELGLEPHEAIVRLTRG
jgi:transcriptional regulator with XRE-family HTH domain